MVNLPFPNNGLINWDMTVETDSTSGATISIWMKRTQLTGGYNLITAAGSSGSYTILYAYNQPNEELVLRLDCSEHMGRFLGPNVSFGVWHHVVVSWTNILTIKPRMYLDSIYYEPTTNQAPLGNASPRNWKPTLGYHPEVDQCGCSFQDYRIYDRQLSDAEVKHIYQNKSVVNNLSGCVFHPSLLNGTGYKDIVSGITGTTSGTVTLSDNTIQVLK